VAKIGKLTRRSSGDPSVWNGTIALDNQRLRFSLIPVCEIANPKAPSHRIVTRPANGADVVIGSAWTKTMIRGGKRGERFFTLTLRHPALSKTLNVAAFPINSADKYAVTFRTRQRRPM
jgi:uncharacterized protein (DUF736 family)